ncbi:MAG: LuxR C-terminal-related transcriptional regulator [Vicinamibacterales bacterium]|nr:LuxR C-terminal-related transcriptional regulator [Vicinamibacterales bacterium]
MLRSRARFRDELLAIIDLAYQAAEEPDDWRRFLERLADAVGGRAVALLFHDLRGHASIGADARNDPEAARLYIEHFCRIDPRALSPRAPLLATPGRPVSDEMLVPYGDVVGTEYHHDFGLRFGIARLMTLAFSRPGGAFSGISVMRAHEDRPFGRDELRFLGAAAPHAARALRLHQLGANARHDRLAALDALERVPAAVLLVTADGRVVHANGAAVALMNAGDGLRLDRGHLRAETPQTTGALRCLCRACAGTTKGEGTGGGGWLLLPRASGDRPLQALVSPMRTTSLVAVADSVAALVYVVDPAHDRPPDRTCLAAYYGFSAAEAQVAVLLAMGRSTKEIADELRYTEQTAAWYCKQVLSKAGCRSRAAYVREVARTLPSLVCLERP